MKKSALFAAALSALTLGGVFAQTTLRSDGVPTAADREQPVSLSPFQVIAENTEGYVSAQVVTGSRIRADVKDLPFNVSVITSDFIADFDTVEFMEALGHTSGMVGSDITPTGMHTRGFGGPVLKDGMSFFGLFTRSSIDRVEIIKGPFAAIYGKTQPGGLVNLVSKRPTGRERQSMDFTVGSLDYKRAEASSSGPVVPDRLFYRVDVGYYEKDGTQDYKRFEQEEYAAALNYRLSADTSAQIELTYMDNMRSRGTPLIWERDPVTLQYTRKLTERFYFNRDGPGGKDGVHFNWLYKSVGGTIDHRFNNFLSARVSGIWWERNQPSVALSGSAFVAPGVTVITGRTPTWGLIARDSLQVQGDLLATFRTGAIEHHGLLSFSWQTEKEATSSLAIPTALRSNALVNLNTTDMNRPVFFYPHPARHSSLFSLLNNDRSGEFEIESAFFSHRMDLLGKRLKVFFGGRYDEVSNRLLDRITGLKEVVPASDFSPQAGFNFALTPRVSFYTSYSESYTPRTQVQSATQQLLPNETGEGVDLGFKTSFFNGKLNLVAGVYAIERNNVLQSVFDDRLQMDVLVPDGQVTTEGVEIDLDWQVTPALQILAGYGYTDNRVSKNPEQPDLVGKPGARGVAPYNYGIRAVYRFQGAALNGLSLRGSLRGQGKSLGEYGTGAYVRNGIAYPNDNRSNIWQPGFSVVDVGAGYSWRARGSQWRHTLSVNLKNVLDERYSIGNWNPQDGFAFSLTYGLRK